MGEAMIARGNTSRKNPLDDVNVVAGYCSLLVRALDSTGKPIANLPVWCKDGNRNYNYNTNAGGYCIFQCNSGAANITAQNFSILDGYSILDQSPVSANYDAPVGTKNIIEIKLNPINTNLTIAGTVNAKFLAHDKLNRVVTIGGGASGLANRCGGGGGAFNEALNVAIDRTIIYNIFIGAGAGWNTNGAAGGTTSAFGISSVGGSKDVGGGNGSYRGGNGHNLTWRESYQRSQFANEFPSKLVSNYYSSNTSDPFRNFGHGGGRGCTGSSSYSSGRPASWYNYTSLIAIGGSETYVTENQGGVGSILGYVSTAAGAGPLYGCGGGGISGSSDRWLNVFQTDRYGDNGRWYNVKGDSRTGAGASGCVLINF